MAERHMLVVLTSAVEGQDAAFNDWYDNRHLADVLKIPGVVSATRYDLSPHQRYGPPYPYNYLALYEIETDDLAAVMAEFPKRSGTAAMPMSEAMADQRLALVFCPRQPPA